MHSLFVYRAETESVIVLAMGKFLSVMHGAKPAILMAGLQFVYAIMNMMFKLAIEDGTNLTVLVTYRLMFATAFIAPIAFFLERKSRPEMTRTILLLAFLTGIFGGFLPLTCFVKAMALTSATFSSAMSNLNPVITFVLSVCFRVETVAIRSGAGKAKVLGTLLSIGGAMMLTFYKGLEITIWKTNINLLRLTRHYHQHDDQHPENPVLGALFSLGGSVSFAIWLIIQTKLSKRFPCHYSSSALMCSTASVLAVVFTICSERNWSHWRITNPIGLITAIYSGVVAFGLGAAVVSWCAKERGPLFVSNFSPLAGIIVVIAANLFLGEQLYIGSFIGAILIVLGLYAMLWGKSKEMKMRNHELELEDNSNNNNDGIGNLSSITVNGDYPVNNTMQSR